MNDNFMDSSFTLYDTIFIIQIFNILEITMKY